MANQRFSSLILAAETIADNKYILGDRLVEIGVSGPNLEATLSSVAMAQAELGHARLLYRWAYELQGLNGSKLEVKDQTGKAFPAVVQINSWVGLIAGLYAVNAAVRLVISAIIKADNQEIHAPLGKMQKELEEHLLYSRNWCRQLLNDRGAVPKVFIAEVEKTASEVTEWLQKVENDNLFTSENIILENSNLAGEYREIIEKLTSLGDVQHV